MHEVHCVINRTMSCLSEMIKPITFHPVMECVMLESSQLEIYIQSSKMGLGNKSILKAETSRTVGRKVNKELIYVQVESGGSQLTCFRIPRCEGGQTTACFHS